MPSITDAVPLRGRPRHLRPLIVAHALAVAVLVVLTVATASIGTRQWFDEAYDVVLPAVVFALPVGVGFVSAVLGGGVVPTLALGAAPSLAWTVAVVVGRALGTLLGTPLPIPDSPLWAIAGAFLLIGLAGALGGFVAGRVGRLAWRRLVG
ncbi:MAG: hypothetical protein V5A61_14285 [Haloarculaceae archaeon]